ncbi:MAG: hypothetical protein A2V66_11105 [Ignavibacteria bacterium RBG_13_36_8]|nr:MAG: hypothetical protein A2V66_11105 [Ignavibacteria bacterium RBG_13_36_8]
MQKKILKEFFLFILLSCSIYAQEDFNTLTVTDTLLINFSNHYKLKALSILPFSESVLFKGSKLKNDEYRLDYKHVYIRLTDPSLFSFGDSLFVTYETILIDLKKEYKRRNLVVKYDDLHLDTTKVIKLEYAPLTSESIFGRDIQKSGSIVRGFTFGTNNDFTLNSGLRLQLSGRLSDEIEIVAALSDENTPIQPEGNTERLEELDKVFIEVRHSNVVGTFGDYDLKEKYGQFGNIDRKLQGLKGEFNFGDNTGVISLAGSRGKYNTNQFLGQDGVQGPYRIYGANNERYITIIAGSENVYLDGVELIRGENNDYTIEYSNAEIIFTYKRIITSVSRITVDFEYTDRNYRRNFFGTSFKTKYFDDRLKIYFSYYREGDDEANPVDLTLSDEEKRIMEEAGSNRNKAVVSGVKLAEPDSTGRIIGIYVKVDTLLNNEQFIYYLYNPGDTQALYDVTFSFVGEGKGDYRKESLGHYKFVGIGLGAYLPVKYLPFPELRQQGNILIDAEPFEKVNLILEFAGSLYDMNRFSNVDDDDNFGYARNISLTAKPREISLGDVNLGKIGFAFRDRYMQDKFTSIDRINDVEFNRYYNIQNDIKANEELREVNLSLQPLNQLKIVSKYGYLKKGEVLTSNRYLTNLNLLEEKSYSLDYNFDYVKSNNNNLLTKWLRQNGNSYFILDKYKLGIEFLHELRKDFPSEVDSLMSTSLKYLELGPYFEVVNIFGFNVKAKYSFREESYPIDGILKKESSADTKSIGLSYRGIPEITSSLDVIFRNKKFTEIYKVRGFTDSETILIRSQSKLNLWSNFIEGDIYYEAATEKSAKLERIFVPVPQGSGNYIYLGDLNNNGIAEENEFELTAYDGEYIVTTIPTDELFPIINLKANTRWEIDFSKFIKDNTFIGKLLNAISTETYVRIEEKSKINDTHKIYLLNTSCFLNDSTTIYGSNYFQHDVYLFKSRSNLSFRLRFTQRKSLNQFSGGLEKGFFRERSLRIRFKMVKEINNQTEVINQTDNIIAPSTSNRARMVTSNEFNTDFSYRPIGFLEVGFKIKVMQNQDNLPVNPTIINTNSLLLRVNLSFAGTGRLRIEFERNELNANTSSNYIPFEITKGNAIGKNYYWRFNFDYRIASNLQTSISYDGRYHSKGKVINTMKAEARAYF